jgi:hypothetical protein
VGVLADLQSAVASSSCFRDQVGGNVSGPDDESDDVADGGVDTFEGPL